MKPEKLALIEKAYQAVRDGKYHDQFAPTCTRAAPAPPPT